MGEVKLFLELAEKMLTVLTKVSFLLGMAILLVYCARYGGIPDGVSVGDSLRIFLAVTVFSVGTLVVYFFPDVPRHFKCGPLIVFGISKILKRAKR